MGRAVTFPAEEIKRLMNIAARSKAFNDAPTLTLFAEVHMLVETAKRRD